MIDREFFRQDALSLAPALIGKTLVRTLPDGSQKRLMITETEAYCGVEDTACHAHKQKRRYTNRLCNDILPLFIVIVLEIRQYSRVLCLD